MCGIVGEIRFDKHQVEVNTLTTMMKKIEHRGPDDNGYFIDKNIGLGFVRLSILDLSSAGHQPMVSDDTNLVIIFNGEIYNYIELREELKEKGYLFKTDTDTEVLLKSYQEWGEEFLNRLNGMWAFIIYNKETKEIFGARDRFGIKPLYYSIDNQRLLFASEIKAIRSVLSKPLTVNEQSLFDYLAFNRTDYSTNTFYNEIKKISHSSSFTVDKNGKFTIKRWYNLQENCNKAPINAKEYLELFTSSVKLRLRSDVPVGVCLSGGLDSSSIVSIIAKKLNLKNINSFSAVYGKGQTGDESEFIEEMKPYLKNMHFTTPTAETLYEDIKEMIASLDEPVPTTSIYAQYYVMKLAKEHAVVTLDGQGADEQLAGYPYFYGFYFKELLTKLSLSRLLSEIFYYLQKHKSLFGIKTFLFFLLPKSIKTRLRVKVASYIQNDFYMQYQEKTTLSEELYGAKTLKESLLRHFEHKLEHLLKWSDLNSMKFSIESRVPFLDYRVVEQTLSLPNEKYIKKGLTKYILRESMKSILPEKIRLRYDKVGFETPEDDWFREEKFQVMIHNIFKNPNPTLEKYIDIEIAKKMYAKHLKREINCSRDIWKWINLNLWLERIVPCK